MTLRAFFGMVAIRSPDTSTRSIPPSMRKDESSCGSQGYQLRGIPGIHPIGQLSGGFRCWHVALAVEEPSRVDEKARSVDLPHHGAVFFDFQEFLGVNVSLQLAANAHDSGLNISFQYCPVKVRVIRCNCMSMRK